jgi:hypothetical protein
MTIIAFLLFAIALGASVGVMVSTIRNALPRIHDVIDLQYAPAMQRERRIIMGEMRRLAPAEVIAFPIAPCTAQATRLAA